MLHEVLRIPIWNYSIPIYGFGLMLVVAFLLASQLAKWLAVRCKLDGEVFINAALLGLLAGVAGARISHVLENLGEYSKGPLAGNLWKMVNLTSGGLTYYGGFLLAFPTLVVYGRWKRVPIRLGMDIIAPCLMVGLGIGRVGCFFNGCCYGAISAQDHFYTVRFPPDGAAYQADADLGLVGKFPPESLRSPPHVAAQLFSTITGLLLASICVAFFTFRQTPGRVFALMMMLEGLSRYVLELVRAEPPVWGPMSLSMVLGIGLVIGGAGLWVGLGWWAKRAA